MIRGTGRTGGANAVAGSCARITSGHRLAGVIVLALGFAAAGCSETASSPVAPRAGSLPAPFELIGAALGGSTLKASTPAITSPAEAATLSGRTVTLTVTNAHTLFVDAALDLQFEIWKSTEATALGELIHSAIRPPGVGSTSYTPPITLDFSTTYGARARAVLGDAAGPWSAVGTFMTGAAPTPVITAPTGQDDIDPFAVRYLHRNIAGWAQTSTITDITIGGAQICVFHTGAGQFPRSAFADITIEGNIWVFAEFGGHWYGAAWDWLRVGQVCKGERLSDLGRDQIRQSPMDGSWNPRSGSTICFAMSARARDGVNAGAVRSNIACTVVP